MTFFLCCKETKGRKLYIVYSLMHFVANCSISYVEVVGQSLSPPFGVEILEPSGKFVLKNDMKHKFHTHPNLPENEPGEISADQMQRRLMELHRIVNLLQGNVVEDVDEYEFGEDDIEAWGAYQL